MGSGYSYPDYTKSRPSPRPEEVGELLMQQSQDPNQMDMEAPGMEMAEPVDPHQAAMGTDWPTAGEMALREAILRGGAMTQGQDQSPGAAGNRAQLLRMGLSEEEIEMLMASGGAR